MNPLQGLKFRHWALIAFILGTMYPLAGCAVEKPVPALLQPPAPVTADEMLKVAELPPYLVPPPADATPRQRTKWVDAQTRALANVHAPPGKVKLKNVGNPETTTTTTVQQGITGRQLTTAAVLVAIVALVLWLKPWRK